MKIDTCNVGEVVEYFGRLLSDRVSMGYAEAVEAVRQCISDELNSADSRELRVINMPMASMILGRSSAPNLLVTHYVAGVRALQSDRWTREGVTEEDIVKWWDLGGVMHEAYVAFDNFFNMAQMVDSAQHMNEAQSVGDLRAYAQWSLRKRFALYGPEDIEESIPVEDRRLPMELRFRIEAWKMQMSREQPENLGRAIQHFSSFNALCRNAIKTGMF